jgi:hypothetical protein
VRSTNRGRKKSIERAKSNQQDLLKQLAPHRRLGGRFVSTIGVKYRDNVHITRCGHDRGKIERRVQYERIDLGLLHGQVMARALAMVFARAMRMVALLIVVMANRINWLFDLRIVAAGIDMRVVPAATDCCMNQQRRRNQTGEQSTHENSS